MITEKKYALLVNLLLQVMFVGILLGLFRTAIPALSESIFNVPRDSFIFLSMFIVAFGVVKGLLIIMLEYLRTNIIEKLF